MSAAISSFCAPRKKGTALANFAALLRGAANAALHRAKAPMLSTWIEARSAGRELTISSMLQPAFSSAVASAWARVVLPAAGGPKSSTIMASALRGTMRGVAAVRISRAMQKASLRRR